MINNSFKASLLLIQVFVVSTCSLTYELLIGTTVTNLTGNSVLAFSLVIGLFLAGLGLGAFCSRWIDDTQLIKRFVVIESSLALVGGFSIILLYSSFVFSPYFQLANVFLTLLIGALSGLEIPILTRILNLEKETKLKSILANVLSFDYLGGLASSLLFPLLLLPYFGLVRLSFLVGLINCVMAFLALYLFWDKIASRVKYIFFLTVISLFILLGAIFSSDLYNFVESNLYRDPIVFSQQTLYQRIVITSQNGDTRMYLNGGIQFSSTDEYRYHESLVVPPILNLLSLQKKDLKIVVLGGGDGLGIRELKKFDSFIEKVYLIDIDPVITDMAKNSYLIKDLNQDSLNWSKLEVLNQDAWDWVKKQPRNEFDLILNDFPDPDETAVAKLYTKEFFTYLSLILKADGLFVTQSSSPYMTPKSFWGINKTMEKVFANVLPYNIFVPSFGLWGFNLASKTNTTISTDFNTINTDVDKIVSENKFLNYKILPKIFIFEPDILNPKLNDGNVLDKSALKINTLDNLILVDYYNQGNRIAE